MAKKDWDIESVERLAKKNREKSMREAKELDESDKTGKPIPKKNKTERQEIMEDERSKKLFNEMKERDF